MRKITLWACSVARWVSGLLEEWGLLQEAYVAAGLAPDTPSHLAAWEAHCEARAARREEQAAKDAAATATAEAEARRWAAQDLAESRAAATTVQSVHRGRVGRAEAAAAAEARTAAQRQEALRRRPAIAVEMAMRSLGARSIGTSLGVWK